MLMYPLTSQSPRLPAQEKSQRDVKEALPPSREPLNLQQLFDLRTLLAQYQRYLRELASQELAPLRDHCDMPIERVKQHLCEAVPSFRLTPCAGASPHETLFARFIFLETLTPLLPTLLPLLADLPSDTTLEGAIQWVCGQHLAIQQRQRRSNKCIRSS